jgi:hypothetical protein
VWWPLNIFSINDGRGYWCIFFGMIINFGQ